MDNSGEALPAAMIRQRVERVFREKVGEDADLPMIIRGATLSETGAVDSLTLLRVMIGLEQEFQMKFALDNLEEVFQDINTIVEYLESFLEGSMV